MSTFAIISETDFLPMLVVENNMHFNVSVLCLQEFGIFEYVLIFECVFLILPY